MSRRANPASTLYLQRPLLILMMFITLVFVGQSIFGWWTFRDFPLVPAALFAAFHLLAEGEFAPRVVSEVFTVFSYAFLHGDWSHLLGNLLFLWIFAAIAVELIGNRWMFAVFFITAACGGLCHAGLNPDSTISMLGASGAVAGFQGLYLAMAVRWRLPDPHVWPIARPIPPAQLAALGVFGLILDYMGFTGGQVGIAYGAHLGGFIGGLFLGGAIVPMPRSALSR